MVNVGKYNIPYMDAMGLKEETIPWIWLYFTKLHFADKWDLDTFLLFRYTFR